MKPSQLSAIFLLLLSGEPGFIRAETVHEVAVGGNISVGCQFLLGGHTKIFCKDDCEEKDDILVETSGNNKCKERYCIEYKRKTLGYDVMYVSITSVTSSDSGRYQCVLKGRYTADGYEKFRIKVTNNAELPPTFTLRPEGPPDVSPTSAPDLTVQTDLYFLLLLTLIPVILVTVIVIYKKRRHNDCEHSQTAQMNEYITDPALKPADNTYQSLSPETRDHNQIYSTLH